jgi:hypothetical protein
MAAAHRAARSADAGRGPCEMAATATTRCCAPLRAAARCLPPAARRPLHRPLHPPPSPGLPPRRLRLARAHAQLPVAQPRGGLDPGLPAGLLAGVDRPPRHARGAGPHGHADARARRQDGARAQGHGRAMRHAPCAMRHAPCAMRHAPCAMRHALCATRHALCAVRCALCAVRRALCAMRHAPSPAVRPPPRTRGQPLSVGPPRPRRAAVGRGV